MITQDYSNITEILSTPFLSNHSNCDFCAARYSIHFNRDKVLKNNYLYYDPVSYGSDLYNPHTYGYRITDNTAATKPITTASPYSNYFNEYYSEHSRQFVYEVSLILSCPNCNYFIRSNKVSGDELDQLSISVNQLTLEAQNSFYDMIWEHSPYQNFILFKCRPSKEYFKKPFDFNIPYSEIKLNNLSKIKMILNNYLIYS